MRRLLILVMVLYVVWRVLGMIGRRLRGVDARERVIRQAGAGGGAGSRRLVECARCGTLIPEDRAVRGPGGVLYCTPTCVEQGSGKEKSGRDGGKLPSATRQD